jgi:hypothetical protein
LLVALAFGAIGCASFLIRGDVIRSTDGRTFNLTRLVNGTDPQIDGKPTYAVPPPVPERQALDVATDYNRQLRARAWGCRPRSSPRHAISGRCAR